MVLLLELHLVLPNKQCREICQTIKLLYMETYFENAEKIKILEGNVKEKLKKTVLTKSTNTKNKEEVNSGST